MSAGCPASPPASSAASDSPAARPFSSGIDPPPPLVPHENGTTPGVAALGPGPSGHSARGPCCTWPGHVYPSIFELRFPKRSFLLVYIETPSGGRDDEQHARLV